MLPRILLFYRNVGMLRQGSSGRQQMATAGEGSQVRRTAPGVA